MTVSEKRSAAARANGAKSRGPVTAEGKARSARNACKHNLLSGIITVRGENTEAFDATVEAYCRRFQPADDIEFGLVEEMVANYWRIRRSLAIEMSMTNEAIDSIPQSASPLDRLTKAFSNLAGTPKLTTLYRYQSRLQSAQSRLIRDFIGLRKNLPPAAEVPGDAGSQPEPLDPASDVEPSAPECTNEPKAPVDSTAASVPCAAAELSAQADSRAGSAHRSMARTYRVFVPMPFLESPCRRPEPQFDLISTRQRRTRRW
jgi:hypothetical protein